VNHYIHLMYFVTSFLPLDEIHNIVTSFYFEKSHHDDFHLILIKVIANFMEFENFKLFPKRKL
jgi:hypothetical protein